MGYTSFITTAYMLRMLSDTERFMEFLASRNIKPSRALLPGIKLIFRFIFDDHIRQVESGIGFALTTDRITKRALSVGTDIRQITSDSPHAKIIRGLRLTESNVLKSGTVSDFILAISREFEPWFTAIDKLWSKATTVVYRKPRSWKKTDIRTLQVFSSLLMLLNIRHRLFSFIRYDHDWRKTTISRKEAFWSKEYPRSLLGYKVTAAYLWDSFRNRHTPEPPVEKILAAGDWTNLDAMFRGVADGIVAEADELLGTFGENTFLQTREYSPRELKHMMKEADTKREQKLYGKLDESFLWYDIELLDTAGRKLFTGVSTFVSILTGAVATKKNHGDVTPLEVRRLLHPGRPKGNDISYAILVPMHSNMADYSGWVVSLFCATDHSGFGNAMRRYAEGAILQFSREVSVSEIHISKDKFRKYLKDKLKQRSEDVWSYLTPTEREILYYSESIKTGIDLSAIVIELFMGVHLAEQGYNVRWRYEDEEVLGEYEIDVLAYNTDAVQIIECSRRLPTKEKEIRKLISEFKRKKKLIEQSEFSRKEITLRYITVKDIMREPYSVTARVLKEKGIEVEDFSYILENSRYRSNPVMALLSQIDHLIDSSGVRHFDRKSSTKKKANSN